MFGGDPSPDHPRGVLPYLAAFVLIALILVAALYLSSRHGHGMSIGPSLHRLSRFMACAMLGRR